MCVLKINKLINSSLLPPNLRFSMLAVVLILAGCSTAPDNTLSHIKRADEFASSQSLTTEKEGR